MSHLPSPSWPIARSRSCCLRQGRSPRGNEMASIWPVLLGAACLMASSSSAQAATRCDCSRKVGACQASITLDGGWLTVTSSSQACSQVVWHADGEPKLTVVTGGVEVEQWLGPTQRPTLSIGSCEICSDKNASSAGGESRRDPNESRGDPIAGRWECRTEGQSFAGGGGNDWWLVFRRSGPGQYAVDSSDGVHSDDATYDGGRLVLRRMPTAVFRVTGNTMSATMKSWAATQQFNCSKR